MEMPFEMEDSSGIESFKEQGFTEEQARKMYKIAKSYSEFAPVSMESALNIIKNNT